MKLKTKVIESYTLSKYISKNLFFAASVLNPSTPLTEATPPKKFASPSIGVKEKIFISKACTLAISKIRKVIHHFADWHKKKNQILKICSYCNPNPT